MSMVEKVARAMWARRREVLAEAGWPRMSLWEHESDALREDFRAEARAAIEAMCQPDDEFMEQLHLRSYDGRFAKSGDTYPVYRNFLRSFIDAALSNTREKDNG